MVDKLTKERRSWNMSQIRSGNTKPEIAVRRSLHSLGYRFRLHREDLPGRPDIVLPKYKTAIFVHGCFWHRHEECKFAYMPKSRDRFWETKFQKNIERDKKVIEELRQLDWIPKVIWECQTRNTESLQKLLLKSLKCLPIKK